MEELILHLQNFFEDLEFQNSDSKIHFWANLGRKKVKVVCFVWKLAHRVFRRCWFLFQQLVFRISNPKLIFEQVWDKKVLAVCLEILSLILRLVFWNSKPKSIFWANLSRKGWIVYFAWKLVHRVSPGGDL